MRLFFCGLFAQCDGQLCFLRLDHTVSCVTALFKTCSHGVISDCVFKASSHSVMCHSILKACSHGAMCDCIF